MALPVDLATEPGDATADFTTILAVQPLPDPLIALAHVGLLGYGIVVLVRAGGLRPLDTQHPTPAAS